MSSPILINKRIEKLMQCDMESGEVTYEFCSASFFVKQTTNK